MSTFQFGEDEPLTSCSESDLDLDLGWANTDDAASHELSGSSPIGYGSSYSDDGYQSFGSDSDSDSEPPRKRLRTQKSSSRQQALKKTSPKAAIGSSRPSASHRIQDQPSQPPTAYHPTESRAREQSHFTQKRHHIGTYRLDEKYGLDDAVRTAKAEDNKNIPTVNYKTEDYRVIKDVEGEWIQQIRFHQSRPESEAFQAVITVIRADPTKRKQLNRSRRKLMARVCEGHQDQSLHLPTGSLKRKWDEISQRIISIDGWNYQKSADGSGGIVQSAVATRHPEEVQELKKDEVMMELQKEVYEDLNRVRPNNVREWVELWAKDGHIQRTNCLPCWPYSGICFNWPRSNSSTTMVPAHRDVLDGLYDPCTVIPVSLDPNDESWSPDSYELCFPALKLKIQLAPMDKVVFPSKIYVHFNSPCQGNGPRRASIVLFAHESLLIKLDQKDLETKRGRDAACTKGKARRRAAFLNPKNSRAGPAISARKSERGCRRTRRKENKRKRKALLAGEEEEDEDLL